MPFAWLPSIQYPPAQDGYWSPVTSTLNWCEEDYYATIYSAEIVNTLTNLMFVYLALRGLRNCIKNGHDTIFKVTFIGYLLVGIGSFCFHTTLKYPWQLVDELSMIYTTCIMCYATFSYGRSAAYSIYLSVALFALALFITLYYHYLQDPAFHQNAYALLTVIVLFRSVWIMEVRIRPRWREKRALLQRLEKSDPSTDIGDGSLVHGVDGDSTAGPAKRADDKAEQRRIDARDVAILSQMWTLIAIGLSVFLGGFAVWNLDNMYCNTLRRWRRNVGLPWGVVLEGHGWWHLMTGMGAYFYIVWGIWLRH